MESDPSCLLLISIGPDAVQHGRLRADDRCREAGGEQPTEGLMMGKRIELIEIGSSSSDAKRRPVAAVR